MIDNVAMGDGSDVKIDQHVRPFPKPILFIARVPPNATGPGGSQRTMHLLNALREHGAVDLIMVHRADDREYAVDTLETVRPLVNSCQRIEVAQWAASYRRWPWLSWRLGQIAEVLSIGSVEAPRFGRATIRHIAAKLPRRDYDVLCAARLSSACIADALMERGLLQAHRRVVDLDDVISRFKRHALVEQGTREGRLRRTLQRLDIARLKRAETTVVEQWDAVSTSNFKDVETLAVEGRPAAIVLPNVVDLPHLPPATDENALRILFVGHLGYSPNVQGLARFLDDIWPRIRAERPDAVLDVVGMYPDADLIRRIEQAGAELHAHVPSVRPYYAASALVVAPIWVGSGTRIKIIEAMAYGRPVVSTTIGAEGLVVEPGRDIMIADDAAGFADAVLHLGRDPALRRTIADSARLVQQANYSPAAFSRGIAEIFDGPVRQPAPQARIAH